MGNTNENTNGEEQTSWFFPASADKEPDENSPGGLEIEDVVFGDREITNWGKAFLKNSELKDTKEENIKIAVLDTGIALNHHDFYDQIPAAPIDMIDFIPKEVLDFVLGAIEQNNSLPEKILQWLRDLLGSFFSEHLVPPNAIAEPDSEGEGYQDFTGSPFGVLDVHGHGTHVAGIIAARENGSGVVGIAPKAKLLIGKVLSDRGKGSQDALAKGINWAVDKGAHIISMSLGSVAIENNAGQGKVKEAIQRADEAGIFMICSAGNRIPSAGNGSEGKPHLVAGERKKYSLEFPASLDQTIAVGALNYRFKEPYYSPKTDDEEENQGQVDIVAPGDQVISSYPPLLCYPPHICAVLSGASMATAFVSGIAALILAKHGISNPNGNNLTLLENGTAGDNRDKLLKYLNGIAVEEKKIEKGQDPKKGFHLTKPKKLQKNK